jgi:hypothetical protein
MRDDKPGQRREAGVTLPSQLQTLCTKGYKSIESGDELYPEPLFQLRMQLLVGSQIMYCPDDFCSPGAPAIYEQKLQKYSCQHNEGAATGVQVSLWPMKVQDVKCLAWSNRIRELGDFGLHVRIEQPIVWISESILERRRCKNLHVRLLENVLRIAAKSTWADIGTARFVLHNSPTLESTAGPQPGNAIDGAVVNKHEACH